MVPPSQTVPSKCLQCNSPLKCPIVCTGCHPWYPLPETGDYFDLFGLSRRYRIDVEELESKFLSISRNIHPDFFGGESEEMRRLSVRLAAELNEALRVLKDPVLRAGYLLEQAGGSSAAADRSVPQSVLTEVMMFREEVEDTEGDQAAVAAVRQRVEQQRRETLEQIADIAEHLGMATEDGRSGLRSLINSIKYYDKLLTELPSS